MAAPGMALPAQTPPTLAHSLLLLSEYTHTLDSLPLDLSRQFADLRELDAVLSSSAQSVTQRIYELVDLIENGDTQKELRMKKLGQIMEEMQRLKHGGEDKIRVATQAADNLIQHKSHLTALLTAASTYDSTFMPSLLYQRTTYPHLPPPRPQDALPIESGRRRRAAAAAAATRGQLVGGLLVADTVSPAKSRKRLRDDEESNVGPTPRKERDGTTVSSGRRGGSTGNKGRRVDQSQSHRANSPSADSVLSITSHTVPRAPAAAAAAAAAVAATATTAAATRASVQAEVASVADDADQGDADEGDSKAYCYCQGPSYGEMVGCDDDHCVYEWFHLTCVGLTSAPKSGQWFCDDCKAKRAGNKKARGGKRRGGASNAASAVGAKAGRGRA